MAIFESFPYTNFHDLNLDWILKALKTLESEVQDFVSLNAIKYADPIIWDITKQYEKNTVVLDTLGNGYLSVQPVPVGVSLDKTEYWTVIGNFSALWADVKQAITPYDEGHQTTASVAHAALDLVFVSDKLLEVTAPMQAGDSYVIGSNCREYSMNTLLHELQTQITSETQARSTADATLTAAVQEEQASRVRADSIIKAMAGGFSLANVICVGDSFLQGYTPSGNVLSWGARLQQKNPSGVFAFLAEGGAGFTAAGQSGHTFNDLLTEYAATLSAEQKAAVESIICLGGINDALTAVMASPWSFITTAIQNFPNAIVVIGDNEMLTPPKTAYTSSLMTASGVKNVHFLTDSFAWLQVLPGYNSGDNTHPTDAGQRMIANMLLDASEGYHTETVEEMTYSWTPSWGSFAANIRKTGTMLNIWVSGSLSAGAGDNPVITDSAPACLLGENCYIPLFGYGQTVALGCTGGKLVLATLNNTGAGVTINSKCSIDLRRMY